MQIQRVSWREGKSKANIRNVNMTLKTVLVLRNVSKTAVH